MWRAAMEIPPEMILAKETIAASLEAVPGVLLASSRKKSFAVNPMPEVFGARLDLEGDFI
jgi:hypothetical protein